MSAAALLKQGVELRELKRFDEAVACFGQAVSLAPADAEAWYQLGLTLSLLGRLDEARASCLKAVALMPAHAEAYNNIGYTLFSAGRWEEAQGCFAQATAIKPDYARAHFNRGLCLRNLQREAEAAESFRLAAEAQPDFIDAHYQRAQACANLQRWDEAAAALEEVVSRQPDHVEAWYQRGKVHALRQEYREAADCFRRVIDLSPAHVPAYSDLGLVCTYIGRPDEALGYYQEALARAPDDAETCYRCGRVLVDLERAEEARALFQQALTLKPDFANARVGLGIALLALNRPEAALEPLQHAAALQADPAPVYTNLGIAHQHLGRMAEALTYYARAQDHDPAHVEAHWNEALCRLTLGELGTGLEKFEWRWKQPEFAALRARIPEPLWSGREDIAGRTVLLWAEQGLGDVLQFCRYVAKVAERGATVVLGVPAPLMRLLSHLPGVTRVDCSDAVLTGYDYHCPLMSLPLAFGTTLTTIPAAVPYLYADAMKIAEWRERLGPERGRRIGLVWSGNPAHKNDRNRSIPLADLAPVLDSIGGPDMEFISVQKEVREQDRAALAAYGIRHYGEALQDFEDTAALLMNVDLVITVDTAVAHLAGALGKPVWILLPYVPDWRWLLEREDSPWYPRARLFRQATPGDWGGVLRRVAEELRR
jgi:tetratricopeptide (TPR) repeat protein